jgi:hypothetical protein
MLTGPACGIRGPRVRFMISHGYSSLTLQLPVLCHCFATVLSR